MTEEIRAVRITIQPTGLEKIVERAEKRIDSLAGSGRVQRNLTRQKHRRNNILGVAAEEAVRLWLRASFPGGDVRDVAGLAHPAYDLEVREAGRVVGVEVKSTTYDRWLQHGRMVDGDQLRETTALVYMWVATPDTDKPNEVHLVGWSTTTDVRRSTSRVRFNGISTFPTLRDTRPSPEPYIEPSSAPLYDAGDFGYDEFEVDQDFGWRRGFEERELSEPDYVPAAVEWRPEPKTFPSGPRALAYLIENQWVEGFERRPGAGYPTGSVQVDSKVRPLSELVDWLGLASN